VDNKPDAHKETSGGKNPDKEAMKPRQLWWRRLIDDVKCKMHERPTKSEERRDKRNNETTEQKAARLTAEATRWIAIFTVVMAIVAALTLWELIQGGADTKALVAASKQQANAASDQADAAQQFSDTAEDINGRMSDAVDQLSAAASNAKAGIKATQDTMRLDQRAWVAVIDVHGPELEPIVKFTNTGRTPARNVIMYPNYLYNLVGIEPDFNTQGSPKRLGVLSPGTERTAQNKMTSIPDLDKRTLYVFGRITYDDIFGKHHWVTYCLRLSDDRTQYQFCEEHNDTDSIENPN
jgi:hypothetical protein